MLFEEKQIQHTKLPVVSGICKFRTVLKCRQQPWPASLDCPNDSGMSQEGGGGPVSFPQCGLDEVSADSKFKMFWKAEPLYLFMTQYSLSGNRDLLLQLLTIVRHSEQTKFNWMSQKKSVCVRRPSHFKTKIKALGRLGEEMALGSLLSEETPSNPFSGFSAVRASKQGPEEDCPDLRHPVL